MAQKILVANSGGLDSAILCRKLNEDGFEVHSVYFDFGRPDEVAAQAAAQTTATNYCVSHKVITVDFGVSPRHYESIDFFMMEDDAIAQGLTGANKPTQTLWAGPPNLGMVVNSLIVSYAKMLGITECAGGMSGARTQEYFDLYNTAQSMNTSLRWRPVLTVPYGAMSRTEALTFTGYLESDFPWCVTSTEHNINIPEII